MLTVAGKTSISLQHTFCHLYCFLTTCCPADCCQIIVSCMLRMVQTAGNMFKIIIILGLTCLSLRIFNHVLNLSVT